MILKGAATAAVGSLTVLVLGAAPVAAGPADGKATGDVTWEEDSASHAISFSAFDSGDEGDRGIVTYSNLDAGFTYSAAVDRVWVSDDAACFQYTIPEDSDAPDGIEGIVVTFQVIDAGTPSNQPDLIGYQSSRTVSAAESHFLTCGFAKSHTTSGNLVVH